MGQRNARRGYFHLPCNSTREPIHHDECNQQLFHLGPVPVPVYTMVFRCAAASVVIDIITRAVGGHLDLGIERQGTLLASFSCDRSCSLAQSIIPWMHAIIGRHGNAASFSVISFPLFSLPPATQMYPFCYPSSFESPHFRSVTTSSAAARLPSLRGSSRLFFARATRKLS